MKLSNVFTAFLLAAATTPATGQADDCSGQKNRFPAPASNGFCMTDGWTNANGATRRYPEDFSIENQVEVYTCPSSNKKVILSNGIPDHDVIIGTNNNGTCAMPYALEIPLDPVYDSTRDLTEVPVRGIVAMARNGVPAFGPQESDSLNALGNVTEKIDASFWYGHRGPDLGWHTHNPNMGNENVDETTFMGWALDGFEIYGPLSDAEAENLDECNGKLGDDGVYRYHVRRVSQVDGAADYCVGGYNNAQNDPRINWKYILGCYSGTLDDTQLLDSTNYQLDSDCVLEGSPTASPTPMPTRDPNAPARPNIIVMQPDDLVFMDPWTPPPNNPTQPNKNQPFPDAGLTNIDALRTGGLQMMQAYTASPKCGTSRYSTITGKMPGRSASIRNLFNDQPSEVTIPNTKLDNEDCDSENMAAALQAEGYATAMVGKWHLTKINRNSYTYTEAVGSVHDCGFDFVSGLYMENMEEANGFNQYATGNFSHNMEWITHEAIRFINETTSQPDPEPFFMYFNPTVPHGSQNILDALTNHTCTDTPAGNGGEEPWIKGMSEDEGCAAYRQTVIDRAADDYDDLGKIWLDDSVGALVQALKDNGVYENTIFLFQQDHGMLMKSTLYEGGTRIPQFVHYPNGITAGSTLDAPVSTVDIAATMMDYAGITNPPYQMDGMSWKNVLGNAEKEAYWKDERCLFFEMDEDRAVRCGCYKYLLIDNDSSETYTEGADKGLANNVGGMLFDLCDGGSDYITDKINNMEVNLVDSSAVLTELSNALSCYQENSNPGSEAKFGACGSAETAAPTGAPTKPPTAAPTAPSYDCTASNGLTGKKLEINLNLDKKSVSEFGWVLTNQLVATNGWQSNHNYASPINGDITYTMCLPPEECWDLALTDLGGDGFVDGYIEVLLGGEMVYTGTDFGSSDGTPEIVEICLGRGQYCSDVTNDFKYWLEQRGRWKKKKVKIDCEKIREKGTGRARKKYCEGTHGRVFKKRANIKKICLKTCGQVAKGDCSFLKDYKSKEDLLPADTMEGIDYVGWGT